MASSLKLRDIAWHPLFLSPEQKRYLRVQATFVVVLSSIKYLPTPPHLVVYVV